MGAGFWKKRWEDVRGNLIWQILIWVFGGGMLTAISIAAKELRRLPFSWDFAGIVFVISFLGIAVVTLLASRRSQNKTVTVADASATAPAPAEEPAGLASLRAEHEGIQRENAGLRDLLVQREEKLNQSLLLAGQFKLETDQLYADTVLLWLREHIHTTGSFASVNVAGAIGLSQDAVSRGLELLRSKYQIVDRMSSDVDAWTFAAGGTPFVPKYKIVSAVPEPNQINVEILDAHQGVRVGWHDTFLFYRLRIVTRSDRSVLQLNPGLSLDNKRENCELISDLSDWVLVKEVPSKHNFTAKSSEDTNLETSSLLKVIETPFRTGIHQQGWIGVKMRGYIEHADLLTTLYLEVVHGAWERVSYVFTPPLPQVDGQQIVASNLRKLVPPS
jgi:hypothetical protein